VWHSREFYILTVCKRDVCAMKHNAVLWNLATFFCLHIASPIQKSPNDRCPYIPY